VTPTARRQAVGYLEERYLCSERRACRVIGAQRRTMRYRRTVRQDEPQLRERLHTLAAEHPRWGYRRLHHVLQREGRAINRKRVYRLYRLEGLAVRRRNRKRAARVPRGIPIPIGRPGEAWAMDFMQDTLASGRRFRTLNVLDTVTRECLRIEVDTSLPGKRVVRVLDQLIERQGCPKRITLDNGPEFTGQALDAWAYAHGVELDFIDPGKPMQNGYQESFNGKFRDECLNLHWFLNLADARRIIGRWEEEYNTTRPHSALGNQPPAVYAHTVWPRGASQNPWSHFG
jgi:putative transposase